VPDRVKPPQQVFLITIDALQYDKLFARHEGKPFLPNLEKLASKSVVFDAAFSAGSATRDAFPSMFTSRWDSQIRRVPGGKSPHGIDKKEVMLAEVLRDKKYKTLAVLPNVYFFPKVWKGITAGFQERVELPNTSRFKGGIHNADEVADRAIEALEKYDPSERLFAWVHFFDAHAPYKLITLPGIGPFTDGPEGRYHSEIQFIDRHVGRVIEAIEARGYSEPLIIVTSDHGTSFDKDKHVRPYGQDLYSDIVRVPLFIWGRAFSPRRDQSLVSTMDLAPTLLNLIGTGRKLTYEGVSLVPQLVGKKPVPRVLHHQLWAQERIVHKKGDPLQWASVRDDRYHFVHSRDHDRTELFDWRKDPYEKTDLLRNPKHAKAEQHLRTTLSRLLSEIYPKKKKKKKD
jgi:arylsulfatase A-like enzyme